MPKSAFKPALAALSLSLLTVSTFSCSVFYPYSCKAQADTKGRADAKNSAEQNQLPVKEVTIFKDGHALLARQGEVTLNDKGEAVLSDLPTPLLGTFFPYSLENVPLKSVTAARKIFKSPSTALSLAELIEANPGADVTLTRITGKGDDLTKVTSTLSGKLAAAPIPLRTIEELNSVDKLSTTSGATAAVKSNLVEIDNENGSTFLPLDQIESLSFKGPHQSSLKTECLKNSLTLNFSERPKGGSARVGMMYVEYGLRWIPSYKIILNGKGRAKLKLEATIVNDVTDLDDVSTQLVVGVPSFADNGETDPISLAKTISDVTNRLDKDSFTRSAMRNAIMAQTAGNVRDDAQEISAPALKGAKHEDIFVFNLKHLSLKKGERMVVPVAESEVPYEDLYTLDIPVKPPLEVARINTGEPAKEKEELKIFHKVRLKNDSTQPFTTAPALILDQDKTLLAQSLITYAPPGSSSDLTVTTAVDLKATKVESESGRQDGATTWLNNKYARINLTGQLTVTNYGAKPVKLEVTRRVLGQVDSTSENGSMLMLNAMDEADNQSPIWWNYYSWPNWWSEMNGIGKFTFKSEIAPQQKNQSTYKWHYFWR